MLIKNTPNKLIVGFFTTMFTYFPYIFLDIGTAYIEFLLCRIIIPKNVLRFRCAICSNCLNDINL